MLPVFGTVVSLFRSHLVCFLTSLVFVYDLPRKFIPLLAAIQLYVYLHNAIILIESTARFAVFTHSIVIVTGELM